MCYLNSSTALHDIMLIGFPETSRAFAFSALISVYLEEFHYNIVPSVGDEGFAFGFVLFYQILCKIVAYFICFQVFKAYLWTHHDNQVI